MSRLLKTAKDESLYHFGQGFSPPPQSVTIEVNYDCTFRCQMCQMWKEDFKPSRLGNHDILTKNEIEKIVEDLLSLEVDTIHFGGGEPFLRKDFLDIVEYCKGNKFYCSAFSNGYLIGEDLAQRIVLSKIDSLHISIDGAQSELHDSIRGVKGAFVHAVQAIRSIKKKQKELNTELPEIFIHCTVSSKNFLNLPEMVDLAKSLEVRQIKFNCISVVGKDTVEHTNRLIGEKVIGTHTFVGISPTYLPQKEQIDQLEDIVEEINERAGDEVKCDLDPLFLNGDKDLLQKYKFPVFKCSLPWISATINPIGDVVPCSMFTDYKMGNLREHPFREIWNNDRARKIRRLLGKRLPPICQQCCVVHTGVPSLWKRFTNKILRGLMKTAPLRS